MPVALIPDIENIVCNYLRDHDDVEALGARIVQKPPAKKIEPWVEVTKLDDLDAGAAQVEYFINFMVQFDCYAGRAGMTMIKVVVCPEAVLLKRTVRAALKEMQENTYDNTVFSAVRFVGGPRFHDEAMDREILTTTFYVHPS